MSYKESHIESPEWLEHIRMRPGMYIGRAGDGKSSEDGIYILLKEVIDNGVDEYIMKQGDRIEVTTEDDGTVTIRDFGRGIPLKKVVDCASRMLTGAKFGSEAFKKSVGLHGVGIKAVNALSEHFEIAAFRSRQTKRVVFSKGVRVKEEKIKSTRERNGTYVQFRPDPEIFPGFAFEAKFVERMLRNYAYLNRGLTLVWNGTEFHSESGLLDLLGAHVQDDNAYPIFYWADENLEVAFTHGTQSGDEYFSYVNGQHTTQGGKHEQIFREIYMRTLRDFFGKNYDASDLRAGLVAAISVRVTEPVFESQTKTKLGSDHMEPKKETLRQYFGRTLQPAIERHLHRHKETANAILQCIQRAEKARKELSGVKKIANSRAKQARIHNKKLTDCSVHFNTKHRRRKDTTLFLTEGDSASGPMISVRDPDTQAVFSLRGKPLNTYSLTKKVVYENEEFYLLQDALNIENGLDKLRFNRVVLATDADVDGMHIRMLIVTFFLQFFPELIRNGHLFILETPLFRVRNKKETRYCYTEEERVSAINDLGPKPEITRFKGLGEISPKEFARFIGKDMRLSPIHIEDVTPVQAMLGYFMGKNTPERQEFILRNLEPETDSMQEDITVAPAPAKKTNSPRYKKGSSLNLIIQPVKPRPLGQGYTT